MGFKNWWLNTTSKIPAVRIYRTAVNNASQGRVTRSQSLFEHGAQDVKMRVNFTCIMPQGWLFPNRESFEHFVREVESIAPTFPFKLKFRDEGIGFSDQLERYFASTLSQRRTVLIESTSLDHQDSVIFHTTGDYSVAAITNDKTRIEVRLVTTDTAMADIIGNGIVNALFLYANPRPLRGRKAKLPVIQPIDVYNQEFEEFKIKQTWRTVWISGGISVGVAIIAVIGRVFFGS